MGTPVGQDRHLDAMGHLRSSEEHRASANSSRQFDEERTTPWPRFNTEAELKQWLGWKD